MNENALRTVAVLGLIVCAVVAVMIVHSLRQSPMKPISNPSMTASSPATTPSSLRISSPSFTEGAEIPVIHTCDGQSRSPDLAFAGIPAGTKSLTLILEDPDAPQGTFTHWIVFNIPPDTRNVAGELPHTTPTFGLAGRNSAGTTEYVGPCPPNGEHRYIFTLYALDSTLALAAGATRAEVTAAMTGHEMAEAQLTGRYGAHRP